MRQPHQIEKSKPILKNLLDNPDNEIINEGVLTIGDRPTSIEASTFLYNLQQNRKQLHDSDYKLILEKHITSQLVANRQIEQIVRPKAAKSKFCLYWTPNCMNLFPKSLQKIGNNLTQLLKANRELRKPR